MRGLNTEPIMSDPILAALAGQLSWRDADLLYHNRFLPHAMRDNTHEHEHEHEDEDEHGVRCDRCDAPFNPSESDSDNLCADCEHNRCEQMCLTCGEDWLVEKYQEHGIDSLDACCREFVGLPEPKKPTRRKPRKRNKKA